MREQTIGEANAANDKWDDVSVLIHFAAEFKYRLFQKRPEPYQLCTDLWQHVGFVIPMMEVQNVFIKNTDELFIDPVLIPTPYNKTVIVWPTINGVFWAKADVMGDLDGFLTCREGFVNKISERRGI